MSVDAATVRRIAHLARIAVTEAEVPHLQGELNAMLRRRRHRRFARSHIAASTLP